MFTGFDRKGAAIMTHPAAGVVRVHSSPGSKSGARMTCLRLAKQQLASVGVSVHLPWQDQPKKEKPVSTVSEDKVRLDSRGIRERITVLATQGKLGPTFTSSKVYEYLAGRYVLPRWSGDLKRPGLVATQQALAALVKTGTLYREVMLDGRGGKRYMYRSAFTEEPRVPLAAAPEPEVEVPDETPDVVNSEPTDATPGEMPDLLDQLPSRQMPSPFPGGLEEQLRSYFAGDLEAENDVLRTALAGAHAALAGALQDVEMAQGLVSERAVASPVPPRPRPHSNIGLLRESRLEKIVETVQATNNLDKSLHIRRFAEIAHLSETATGNALNTAKRRGWRSTEGITVTQTHRGYYVLNSPKGA